MDEKELQAIEELRYNQWCHRRPTVSESHERTIRAIAFGARSDLAPSVRAALTFRELTRVDGLEFVGFSNIDLGGPIGLKDGSVIVPCFLTDLSGISPSDPMFALTVQMRNHCRFVYDGWLPIGDWEERSVESRLTKLEEVLAVFALRGHAYFTWEPKYGTHGVALGTLERTGVEVERLEGATQAIERLDESDRTAVYRSVAWLGRAAHNKDPIAKFLFSFFAIEALAMHIERGAAVDSKLISMRTSLPPEDKKAEVKNCIEETLARLIDEDPVRAVLQAHSECVVGIGKVLRQHVGAVLRDETGLFRKLFVQKVDGKTLHKLAHGSVNVLSELERERVSYRADEANLVARRYVCNVLDQCLGTQVLFDETQLSVPADLRNAIVSSEEMYKGPTHMAYQY